MQPEIQDTITIERSIFTNLSTIGELYLDGRFFCFTLEDTCRKGEKVYGKTAIPAGKYEIKIEVSPRLGVRVPWLLNVPGFTDIQIHRGNSPEDTNGCILVGFKKGTNMIYESRKAFDALMPEIESRIAKGKQYVAVLGGR